MHSWLIPTLFALTLGALVELSCSTQCVGRFARSSQRGAESSYAVRLRQEPLLKTFSHRRYILLLENRTNGCIPSLLLVIGDSYHPYPRLYWQHGETS